MFVFLKANEREDISSNLPSLRTPLYVDSATIHVPEYSLNSNRLPNRSVVRWVCRILRTNRMNNNVNNNNKTRFHYWPLRFLLLFFFCLSYARKKKFNCRNETCSLPDYCVIIGLNGGYTFLVKIDLLRTCMYVLSECPKWFVMMWSQGFFFFAPLESSVLYSRMSNRLNSIRC